jgi:tripeptidyl-peptidase-1
MFVKILFTVAVAAQAAFGTPIQSRSVYAVKERHNLPRGWKNAGRASKSQMMYLRIGVKQSKFDELERHLYEVSDPEHVRYGKVS